jgi:hypothetical protein
LLLLWIRRHQRVFKIKLKINLLEIKPTLNSNFFLLFSRSLLSIFH